MKQQTPEKYEIAYVNRGILPIRFDREDLEELLSLDLNPRWWTFKHTAVETPLPGGSRIALARLITEAPAGYRVRYRDRNPRNLCRSNLYLRPFTPAKQDGKEAKDDCRRLAELNRQMQERARSCEQVIA